MVDKRVQNIQKFTEQISSVEFISKKRCKLCKKRVYLPCRNITEQSTCLH